MRLAHTRAGGFCLVVVGWACLINRVLRCLVIACLFFVFLFQRELERELDARPSSARHDLGASQRDRERDRSREWEQQHQQQQQQQQGPTEPRYSSHLLGAPASLRPQRSQGGGLARSPPRSTRSPPRAVPQGSTPGRASGGGGQGYERSPPHSARGEQGRNASAGGGGGGFGLADSRGAPRSPAMHDHASDALRSRSVTRFSPLSRARVECILGATQLVGDVIDWSSMQLICSFLRVCLLFF
jgi:hypothetical protein